MKTTALLLLCFVLTANFCSGQNLVPNPSFEEMYSCPNNTNQVDSCVGWQLVHKTPDYFATCAPYPVSVPDNFVGYQEPYDGSSYMGLITYDWFFFWREIIGTKLLSKLIPGNSYHVSFRASRGNWTNQAYNCAASNKLGIRFTTYPYTELDTPTINNQAHVYTDSIITDTLEWTLLSWNFVADSAYQYMYLGNFFDNNHTDTVVINAPLGQFGIAYYFLDSVNVFCKSTSCATSVEEQMSYSIIYNSSAKLIEVSDLEFEPVWLNISDFAGKTVSRAYIAEPSVINVSEFPAGMYFINIESKDKNYARKIIIY